MLEIVFRDRFLSNCFFLHSAEAAHRNQLREHDQKAALLGEIRRSRKKTRIIKNSARCRIPSATYCNQEILSLTHYPISHASLTIDKD